MSRRLPGKRRWPAIDSLRGAHAKPEPGNGGTGLRRIGRFPSPRGRAIGSVKLARWLLLSGLGISHVAWAQEDIAGYVGHSEREPVAWNDRAAPTREPVAWQSSGGREPVAWNADPGEIAAAPPAPISPPAVAAVPSPAVAAAPRPVPSVAATAPRLAAPSVAAAPAPAVPTVAIAPSPPTRSIAAASPPATPSVEAAPAAPPAVVAQTTAAPQPATAAVPNAVVASPSIAVTGDTSWSVADAAAAAAPVPGTPAVAGYGPPPAQFPPPPPPSRYRYARSFGAQFDTVKWEVAGIAAWMTGINAYKVSEVGVTSFRWQNEGWFGKDTDNLGIDKLTHAFNSYWLADLLTSRIRHKTGDRYGGAVTGAVLASGLMIYSELWDAHKKSSGFSYEDVVANTLGAGFSVIRNTVPGLKEKLDFRLLLIPNSSLYTFEGKGHYAQQRYLLAVTLAGFEGLNKTPLRYVELQGGYYAKGFTHEEQRRGEPLRRRIFFGVALNLKELIFPSPESRIGRAAASVLDYIQIPYTGAYVPVTK